MKRSMKEFGRRRFLRGVGGVTVGLPLLESFLSGRAYAQAQKRIYTMFMCQQNGCIQGTSGDAQLFWPSATGALSAATMAGADANKTTSELRDYAAKLTLVRGVNYPFGNPVGCGHSSGCNQTLTAAKMKGSSNRSLPVSESADVRIAKTLTPGREPLALYAGKKSGYLDDALSYREDGAVRAGENNPWNAYQRLVGLDALSMSSPTTFNKLAARRKSVNDLLRGQIQSLTGRSDISQSDKARLDVHFSSIRDMEVAMTQTMGSMPLTTDPALATSLQSVNGTHTANDKMEDVVKLQLSLIAFAFASDRARAATMQVGGGNDHTQYRVNGTLAPPYHYISHRVMSDGGSGTSIGNAVDLHHGIDRIHARFFKHFLDRMSAYQLPDGRTLLDDSVAVWLNSNANGPPHSVSNIPHVVAGSAGGFLKTGQYINAGGVGNNKFLNTIITAAGAPTDSFGDAGLAKGLIPAMVA